MKSYSFYVALGAIGTLALGSGCSSSTEASTDDTTPGLSPDATAAAETSAEENPGTDGAPSTTTAEASDDSEATLTCAAFTTGSTTCDQCIQQNCCAPAAACDTETDAGLDDGGLTSCEDLVSCVTDVCSDGGVLSDCEATCNPTYDSLTQATANTLLTCVGMQCQSQCQ